MYVGSFPLSFFTCTNSRKVEPIYNDIARLRINKNDFEHIRPLARGQFAQVIKVSSNLYRISHECIQGIDRSQSIG